MLKVTTTSEIQTTCPHIKLHALYRVQHYYLVTEGPGFQSQTGGRLHF